MIADKGDDQGDPGGARRGLEESGERERQLSQRGVLCEENWRKVGSSTMMVLMSIMKNVILWGKFPNRRGGLAQCHLLTIIIRVPGKELREEEEWLQQEEAQVDQLFLT